MTSSKNSFYTNKVETQNMVAERRFRNAIDGKHSFLKKIICPVQAVSGIHIHLHIPEPAHLDIDAFHMVINFWGFIVIQKYVDRHSETRATEAFKKSYKKFVLTPPADHC